VGIKDTVLCHKSTKAPPIPVWRRGEGRRRERRGNREGGVKAKQDQAAEGGDGQQEK